MLEIIMCPIFVQLVFQTSRSNSGPKSRKWIHKKTKFLLTNQKKLARKCQSLDHYISIITMKIIVKTRLTAFK